MVILGLTGSIGMGKTTAAMQLRRLGLPVHDADATVHRLMARGGAAVPAITRAFPDAVRDGVVDRAALGAVVYADLARLRELEAILHPLVRADSDRFLQHWARHRAPLVVLDVPLLFEGGGDRRCDATMVVSAPAFVQAQRVLRRPGMTPARLARIRSQQLDDREKRRRADFVVHTGLGKGESLREIREAVDRLRGLRGRRWPPWHGGRRRGRAITRRANRETETTDGA